MNAWRKKLPLLILTALPALWCTRSCYGAEPLPIVLKHVPAGYVVEAEGYFVDIPTMQEITAMVQTYRTERDIWAESYKELSEESLSHAAEQRENLAALKKQLGEERAAWKSALRKAKNPGFGIFIGAGYTGSGVEPVIGAGVVWRLF